LAGLQLGVYSSIDDLKNIWRCDYEFDSSMSTEVAEALYNGWCKAVRGVQVIAD